ncbi:hypothetical protein P154DRAFT_622854 [Amniculicola lignicola CBS 123094]|uniref:F-box domain-containing protein n=1 Tax=Amniculicola lignicola CBS 123094 TaxID=1392246 RepID=A0A6A5WGW7_9PLEO|nr:hypothetical protein P154DRAFT_622854 [Amniculicola lignicola CBS 123094]
MSDNASANNWNEATGGTLTTLPVEAFDNILKNADFFEVYRLKGINNFWKDRIEYLMGLDWMKKKMYLMAEDTPAPTTKYNDGDDTLSTSFCIACGEVHDKSVFDSFHPVLRGLRDLDICFTVDESGILVVGLFDRNADDEIDVLAWYRSRAILRYLVSIGIKKLQDFSGNLFMQPACSGIRMKPQTYSDLRPYTRTVGGVLRAIAIQCYFYLELPNRILFQTLVEHYQQQNNSPTAAVAEAAVFREIGQLHHTLNAALFSNRMRTEYFQGLLRKFP